LVRYLKDPAASSCTDLHLLKTLNKYNPQKDGWHHLEDLEEGRMFRTATGKIFIKGKQLRKNFECYDEQKHKYFVHPLMEVMPLE
jgi:SprT protein